MSSSPDLLFFSCKRVTLGPDLQVCIGPTPHLWFWAHITAYLAQELKRLYGFQPSPVVSCMQISDFNTRMSSLYGFQLSSVVLFMQNSDFKTNLYWSQPSSVVFASKTASLGPKLHVSMGPSPHLWFSACKSATLAYEILVSIGPSPHLWFLHAKQRLLDQHTSLYEYQT